MPVIVLLSIRIKYNKSLMWEFFSVFLPCIELLPTVYYSLLISRNILMVGKENWLQSLPSSWLSGYLVWLHTFYCSQIINIFPSVTFPSFNQMFFNHYLVQFYIAFPQIHRQAVVLSLPTSHISEKEEGCFGRQEGKDGKVKRLLKFFFPRASNSPHLFCPSYSPKLQLISMTTLSTFGVICKKLTLCFLLIQRLSSPCSSFLLLLCK